MTRSALTHAALATVATLILTQPAAAQPAELGQGWLPELELAARQLEQLAVATPAEKFGWRPAPGVRSFSEIYMHVALGNYYLLQQSGVESPVDLAARLATGETALTAKDEVIDFLKGSFAAVRASYPAADGAKKVQFFGREATTEGVLLRLLVHNHEHMGQAIAYARMNGVVPPWSRPSGE